MVGRENRITGLFHAELDQGFVGCLNDPRILVLLQLLQCLNNAQRVDVHFAQAASAFSSNSGSGVICRCLYQGFHDDWVLLPIERRQLFGGPFPMRWVQ
ncbi:MAG: hypothetical protein KatS3mg105_2370 [Gemmatales bacterium]|nr:MAG: hypothetical protein KatS3mg105_2370 [Gemmatales bacterium]